MRSRNTRKSNPRVRYLGTTSDHLDIWSVDGEFVRDHLEIDFVAGGNHGRYPRFIPRNEIWVEQNLTKRDRDATVLHELVERHHMLFGNDSYSKAHDKALVIERRFRRAIPRN